MIPTPRPDSAHRRSGASIIAFGIVGLLGSAIAMIVTQRAMVDLLQIAVIANGLAVARGSERGVYWGVILTGFYALVALVLCVPFIAGLAIKFGGREVTILDTPWLTLMLLTALIWSWLNLIACIRLRRRWKRVERNQCIECGYPMGAGDTCPECGAALR